MTRERWGEWPFHHNKSNSEQIHITSCLLTGTVIDPDYNHITINEIKSLHSITLRINSVNDHPYYEKDEE